VSAPASVGGALRPAWLGLGQIVSWGTLFYSFPLVAVPMSAELGVSKLDVYGAASLGLVSGGVAAVPIGRLIDTGRGRAVLTLGAIFGALMLGAWSRLETRDALMWLFVGIGIAQAACIYEPAFAVLARHRPADARDAITRLTLWGGFASTVFVPLTQGLLETLGWRQTLVVLGFVQLGVAAVANRIAIGDDAAAPPARAAPAAAWSSTAGRVLASPVFWILALVFTLYFGAFSALALHLYPLLVERGAAPELVVLVIAVIGPAQVLGRLLLWKLGADLPIRPLGIATLAALCLGLVLLHRAGTSATALIAFGLIYGAGNGVITIVRGLVVPEMLSRRDYGSINGLLAAPSLVAKALAPVAAAWVWTRGAGYEAVLEAVLACSLLGLAGFVAAASMHRRLDDAPTQPQ
jgi:predicted MFS family arabinose efflux permease